MKRIYFSFILLCLCFPLTASQQQKKAPVWSQKSTKKIFQTSIKTLQGKKKAMKSFQGKALLFVNVASKCGYTKQYAGLENLQKKYEKKGFTVIGIPCNQFGQQEPGTAKQILDFCSATYGVTFPMLEKTDVNGAKQHPLYQLFTKHADANGKTGPIKWNFEKFLISADGKTMTRFSSKVKPESKELIEVLEKSLPKA